MYSSQNNALDAAGFRSVQRKKLFAGVAHSGCMGRRSGTYANNVERGFLLSSQIQQIY